MIGAGRAGLWAEFSQRGGVQQQRKTIALKRRLVGVQSLSAASRAEISAVCAGVPQLGASLPSPQARGR